MMTRNTLVPARPHRMARLDDGDGLTVCAAGTAVEASAPLEGEQERPPGAYVISFASFGPLDTDLRGRSAAGGDAFRETQVR